jgi:hypothetical protein
MPCVDEAKGPFREQTAEHRDEHLSGESRVHSLIHGSNNTFRLIGLEQRSIDRVLQQSGEQCGRDSVARDIGDAGEESVDRLPDQGEVSAELLGRRHADRHIGFEPTGRFVGLSG